MSSHCDHTAYNAAAQAEAEKAAAAETACQEKVAAEATLAAAQEDLNNKTAARARNAEARKLGIEPCTSEPPPA